jgi:AcrR family transcriptional regulator
MEASIGRGGPSGDRAGRPKLRRKIGPAATKADILRIAQEEFAARGLSGARVDAIAARTRTTKRALYYHFGSKEGLYIAVLERVYSDIRGYENQLGLADMAPNEALKCLVEFTFDYDETQADFVRLVSIENIHRARYLARSSKIRDLNNSVIETLAGILHRGREDGLFRGGIEAIDVHMLISALCFFRVSNRHTFRRIFRHDLLAKSLRQHHREVVVETVMRYVERRPSAKL